MPAALFAACISRVDSRDLASAHRRQFKSQPCLLIRAHGRLFAKRWRIAHRRISTSVRGRPSLGPRVRQRSAVGMSAATEREAESQRRTQHQM